jgi:hypothetical protein
MRFEENGKIDSLFRSLSILHKEIFSSATSVLRLYTDFVANQL